MWLELVLLSLGLEASLMQAEASQKSLSRHPRHEANEPEKVYQHPTLQRDFPHTTPDCCIEAGWSLGPLSQLGLKPTQELLPLMPMLPQELLRSLSL